MGSDDLRKKQREKKTAEVQRKKGIRAQYEKVLIVCEGSKTEPSYFEAYRDSLRLSAVNVEIPRDNKGRAPSTVVEYANNHFMKSRKDDPYDKVFCVFDRDDHQCFHKAKHDISVLNKKLKREIFCAIESTPSFEYWYLLHFKDAKRPYIATQKKSTGKLVEEDLKAEYPAYTKSSKTMFQFTLPKIDVACERAKKNWTVAMESDNMNPSTNVFKLVEFLRDESIK